ncbi:MAG: hypothetical protein U9Q83_08960 [Bacteroidota bacterium]|nr:hypothetical protein [Bacteroidota bacterium]
MKRILFFLLVIFSISNIFSQDIDFFLKNKNENYLFPSIPSEMTFQEFNLLSQTFRMQDMLYSTIVPGYVHFKAQENACGYTLVAVRTVALSMLTYEYVHYKNTITDTVNFFKFIKNSNQLTAGNKADAYIVGISLLTFATTYLFDIIHGKYILQKKQEKIRFKYSPKISFFNHYSDNNKLGLNLGMTIYF